MSESKWWAGIKAGINFTSLSILESHAVFQSMAPAQVQNQYQKNYASRFKNLGYTLGAALEYHLTPAISLLVQPAFAAQRYNYQTTFIWYDSLSNSVTNTNQHLQQLYFVLLPLQLKYGYTLQLFRFYFQAGASYAHLVSASRRVDSQEKYLYASGTEVSLNNFSELARLESEFLTSHFLLTTGLGISIDLNFFRIGLEANYRYGLTNMTDRSQRYNNDRLVAGIYDVPDDHRLHHLELVFVCSTPLDYLIHSPGFSAKPVRRR